MSEELKQVRIDLGIIRTRLALAVQKEREFYAMWKDSTLSLEGIKKAHTSLIIREAELVGKVSKPSASSKVKVKVEKAVDDMLTASLKSLSKEDREALIAGLMDSIQK